MLELRWSTHFYLWSYIYIYTVLIGIVYNRKQKRKGKNVNDSSFKWMPDKRIEDEMKAKEYSYVCVLLLNVFNVMVVSTIKMKKIGKWWWSGALENI